MSLRSLEDPSSARVIVTLHEPLGTPGPADSRAGARTQRLARIATVEHDFADGASRLGFRATAALTHFAIVAGEISPERLEHLAALRQVKAIEPDRTLRADLAEGKALINANDVASLGGDGDGVTVVVIDSGINASHGELAGKIDEQRSYSGPVGQDGFNHGTKVAGIIAGDSGLAPAGAAVGHPGDRQQRRDIDRHAARGARRPDAERQPDRHPGRRLLGSHPAVLELVRQPPARLGGRGQFLP